MALAAVPASTSALAVVLKFGAAPLLLAFRFARVSMARHAAGVKESDFFTAFPFGLPTWRRDGFFFTLQLVRKIRTASKNFFQWPQLQLLQRW